MCFRMQRMTSWVLRVVAGLFWSASSCVQGQQDAATVLRSLAEQTKEYQRSIPNFTCNEVVTTKVKKGDKVLRRIEFQADIRVQRKEDKSLNETFWITSYMGKLTPNGGKFEVPVYMEGGLGHGLPTFFAEKYQPCYDYRLDGNRINFRTRPGRSAECHEKVDTTGFGLMDSDGKLLYGEIKRPPEEADHEREVSLARIDYSDVRLNNRVFRMPTHVYGEEVRGGKLGTFDAYYTSCKLFAAKTTIRPGDGTDPPAP